MSLIHIYFCRIFLLDTEFLVYRFFSSFNTLKISFHDFWWEVSGHSYHFSTACNVFFLLAAFKFFCLSLIFSSFIVTWPNVVLFISLKYAKILRSVFFIRFGKLELSISQFFSAPASLSSPLRSPIIRIREPIFILLQSFSLCSSEWIVSMDLSSNSMVLSSLISNSLLISSCKFCISITVLFKF